MIIDLLVIGYTLVVIQSILFTNNGIEKSLQWIIFAFILGYRTFEPIPGLKLHPIEVFVYVSIIRIIVSKPHKYSKIPFNISILSIFFFTYFIIDCLTRYNPNVLLEFKNGILLLMIFYVVQHIQIRKVYIIKLLKSYLFSATIISTLGILELLFPSMIAAIFGYRSEPALLDEPIFFSRLAFLFWGSHLAANLIPPVFPMLLVLKEEREPIANNNYFLTLLILVNLFAIYLSGNRLSWLIMTIFLIIIILYQTFATYFGFRYSDLYTLINPYSLSIILLKV